MIIEIYNFEFIHLNLEARRGAAAQSVTVNLQIVGPLPARGGEIFT